MKKDISLPEAFAAIREHMHQNPDYAHGWHCNIAMACKDSIDSATGIKTSHKTGNEAASRFMKACFGVETSNDMLGKGDDNS